MDPDGIPAQAISLTTDISPLSGIVVPSNAVEMEFRDPPLPVRVKDDVHRPRVPVVGQPVGDSLDDVLRGLGGIERSDDVVVATLAVRHEPCVDTPSVPEDRSVLDEEPRFGGVVVRGEPTVIEVEPAAHDYLVAVWNSSSRVLVQQ